MHETDDTRLIKRAARFAEAAHAAIDQQRRYTNEPFIAHPRAVAKLAAKVTDEAAVIASSWLHDVVEDSPLSIRDIEAEFNWEVASLVNDLTDVSKPADGNRAQRQKLDRVGIAKADPHAKTVKLADIVCNVSDIAVQDPQYGKKYAHEKLLMLAVLTDGDPKLFEKARRLIESVCQH